MSVGTPGQALAGDTLRAVLDSVFTSGQYEWTTRRDPLAFLRTWWLAVAEWLESLAHRHPELYTALIWALAVLLGLIVMHWAWVMLGIVRGAVAPPTGIIPEGASGRDELEWARTEVRRLAAGGRYAEAVRMDFHRLVLELDARSRVRFHPGKTPSEYLRDPALPPADRGWLAGLVQTLYGVAYAGRPCDAEGFAVWQRQAGDHAATH
jgi:hypothetical protein